MSNDPANNDQERGNKKSNLDARADGNTHSQIHLVAHSHHDRRDMLSSVADNRDQNQADKCLANSPTINDVVDASHKVLGANGNQKSRDDKNGGGGDGPHAWLFRFVILGSGLALGVEQVAVGAELENKVHDIEDKEDDSSSSRQDKDAPGLLIGTGVLIENGIKL